MFRIKDNPNLMRYLRLAAFIGLAAIVLALICISYLRTQRPVALKVTSQQSVAATGPLEVSFGQDVAAGFEPSVDPSVPGAWQSHRTVLGVSSISFKPEKRFQPGKTYTVRVKNLKRSLSGGAIATVSQTFRAQVPPLIKAYTPGSNDKNVATTPRFAITLASASGGTRDLQPTLAPAVPLKLISSDGTKYIWEPAAPLKQGTAYNFTLEDKYIDNPSERQLLTVPFTTVAEPIITAARTGGFFGPGQNVDIVFSQAMEPSTKEIIFNIGGKGSWADDHTYRFIPADLKTGTTYNYTVKSGLRSKLGGFIEADHPFQFATNGPVGASVSPGGGNVAITTPVRVAFDQAVDHASAESRFRTAPTTSGKFSWSGNTMTYTPSGLSYQTGYSVSVAPGVVPAWGQPSNRVLGSSFTTAYQTIKLSVPAYRQQYPMSCELSSLRMLLAFRGINVSDYDILMRIGYHPRAKDQANNSWDDPNQTYVGFVDQAVFRVGYGVHAGPVAAAGRSYGRNAISQFGVSAGFISANIHAGNPVEVWGHIVPAKPDSWNTSSGVVQTTTSQHARVVTGVVGSADNPVGFYVNDPYTGANTYWTAGALMANMNAALPASNQAVVVY
jgi:uncharacterized protein YvpB